MSWCQNDLFCTLLQHNSQIYKEAVGLLKRVGCRPDRLLDCETVGCGCFSDEAQTAAILIIDCVCQP